MDVPIVKLPGNGGFEQEYDTHTLRWDADGRYIGQWQDNVLDNDVDRIFIAASPYSKVIVPDLTQEQMGQK